VCVCVCAYLHPDVTAVCILECFQNQQSMLLADKVLKSLGKEKAKDKYKVGRDTSQSQRERGGGGVSQSNRGRH